MVRHVFKINNKDISGFGVFFVDFKHNFLPYSGVSIVYLEQVNTGEKNIYFGH